MIKPTIFATGRHKGQAFIAGAAIIIVILALLRTSATQINADIGILYISNQLDNIEHEFNYAAGLSRLSGSDNIAEFSQYLREKIDGFSAFYLLINVDNAGFTATAGNFLKERINVNISVQGATSSSAIFAISDKNTQTKSFSAVGTINLNLIYANREKNLTFEISPKTILIYDIGIDNNGNMLRRIGTWSG